MIVTQRLPPSLTPLDTARALLLDDIRPVAPCDVSLIEALGCTADDMPPLRTFPASDVAATDGWALGSRNLVGASSYSPLPLASAPPWVEAGDRMPRGCDCVVDSDLVEPVGPLFQVLAEATSGQGVRCAGRDIAQGSWLVPGRPVHPLDLLIARTAGLVRLAVRRPQLRLVDVVATAGETVTAQLIAESARAAGADVICDRAGGRDPRSIAKAFDGEPCDLIVIIGGTGVGRTDAAVAALADHGALLAHGIALRPGRTTAIGKIAGRPAIALPGAPDQALAGWWTLALPALDRLSGRAPRQTTTLPLVRKIASSIGVVEIVLLEKTNGAWMPRATGDLALGTIAAADAWLAVPGGSEGYAAGTPVDAYMLRD